MIIIQARRIWKALTVACAMGTLLESAELRLASGGQPLADIVVPSSPHPAVTYAWNGDFTSCLHKGEKSWSLLLTVPFRTLGYNEMPQMPSMSFIRYVSNDNTRSTVAYWNDCSPHNSGSFTEIIMK